MATSRIPAFEDACTGAPFASLHCCERWRRALKLGRIALDLTRDFRINHQHRFPEHYLPDIQSIYG